MKDSAIEMVVTLTLAVSLLGAFLWAVFGSLTAIFLLWRDSSKKIADDRFENVAAASENMVDASDEDKEIASLTPTEEELRLLAYIVMDKGDSARLNNDEQDFFIKVIREAKAKLEGGHRNEFWAKVYVSEKLKEFGSPALNVVAEFYVDKLAPN
ncbi:hypothetical protein [Aeromonas hydrophila]|uniref:hypothetical protein n=1 Tax=Aeromonas hydrophila TaxID=644 RepID=UPI002B4714D2|nr:hypothetical protein [Aeromonas hydrophila]